MVDNGTALALLEGLAANCADDDLRTESGTLMETLESMVRAFLQMNAALMAVNAMSAGEVVAAVRMIDDDPTQGSELIIGVATPEGVLESVFSTEVQLHRPN